MSLQIGRVGLSPTLESPEEWHHEGDRVQVTGVLYASTLNEAKALRQQVLGLVDNVDEPVVPVVWTEDPSRDGFYRVRGARVETIEASLSANWFPYSISLERVSDYSAPLVESLTLAPSVRSNEQGVIESDVSSNYRTVYLPASIVGLQFSSTVSVATEDGVDVNPVAPAAAFEDGGVTYQLTPADWYVGACRVELDYGNTGTFRPVAGRQVVNLAGEDRWRLSNGSIRLTVEDVDDFIVGVSRWDGAAWTTPKTFAFTRTADDSVFDVPTTLTVRRNSQADATVRLTGGTASPYVADFRLRRGARHFEISIYRTSQLGTVALDFQLGRAVVDASVNWILDEAGSARIIGIRDGSADGDGIVWTIGSPYSDTPDNTNGRLGLGNELPGLFVLGAPMDDDVTSGNAYESVAGEYFAAVSETVRVVER